MEIKYEAVFGPQELFDGAPEDAEYAGWFCQEIRWYMILNGKILFSDGGTWCTSDNPYLSADIAAMRRIIKEPERWTVEDQKAGRLPEVGVKVALNLSDEVVKSSAIQSWENGDELEVLRTFKKDEPNGKYASALFNLRTKTCGLVLTKYLSPIETAAEKAQREEDEFIVAMLDAASQEQLMSAGFKSGVIAAYRKLKGGE